MQASPRLRRVPPTIARAAGVTRVARLTGLDRTGVEVASAIRPRGHVLQVTNGKGERFEDAALGAVMEAAELAAAERPAVDAWGSAAELAARSGRGSVLSPADLEPARAEPWWGEVRLAWREGTDLLRGGSVLVPAHAVHVPPAGAGPLGPALVRWTSNGMGAAGDRHRALLQALLEAIERDRLARALPDGFTPGEIGRRLLDRRSVERAAPRAAALAERIEGRGFRVYLLDVSGRDRGRHHDRDQDHDRDLERDHDLDHFGDPRLPCASALIVDREGGPVPVAAGYACRLSRGEALRAALLEAAQSRATEIHGAREDVAFGDRRAATVLAGLLVGARAGRDARRMPDVRAATPAAGVRAFTVRLRRAGIARAAAVDLDGPAGTHVVKVLVPGLLLSELL